MNASSRDPEVEQLTSAVRQLVGQAYRLSLCLDETVSELEAYVQYRDRRLFDRRVHQAPIEGEDRRRADQ